MPSLVRFLVQRPVVRHWLLILAVSGTALLTNLGGVRLWDRDEPRNAGCAAEMLARGDWVTPVFNGELRVHKPVLLYWFMMSAYAVFGVNEFSARLWSALLGMGIALQTYTIGRRLFHPRVGLWAAIVLSTALMFDVAGRAATPDSVFMFFTTLSLLIYVLGTFRSADSVDGESPSFAGPQLREPGCWFPRRWTTALAMYGAMGVAVLAKGPAGLVLPTAVIGMFLLIMRLPASGESGEPVAREQPASGITAWMRWAAGLLRPFAPMHFLRTCWMMRPLTAVAVTLAIALPWYVWVGWRTNGEFIRGFLLEHNLGRALRPMEGHSGPLLYYPAAIMMGFFPWSVFLVPLLAETVRRIRARHPWLAGYVLASCWVGVYVGLFSLARTKLPSYITPCYPGLALLAGGFVYHWSRGESLTKKHWQYVAVTLLGVAGLGILVAIPLVANVFLPGEQGLALLGLIPLVGAGACLAFLRKTRFQAAAVSFAVTALLFVTTLFGWCATRVNQHRGTDQLLAALDLEEDARIGSLGCLEPSWVFYSRHSIEDLRPPAGRETRTNTKTKNSGTDTGGADTAGADTGGAEQSPWQIVHRRIDQPQGTLWVKRPQTDAEQFLLEGERRYVITTDRVLQRRWKDLPDEIRVKAELPYFLEKERLVVLERVPEARRMAARKQTAPVPDSPGPAKRR